MTTEQVYNKIMQSNLFRRNGEAIDVCDALNELVDAIQAEEETNWYLGEGEERCLSDLIAGAYWAMYDCHAGQDSPEYATACKLGEIFSPGMSSYDSDNSGERAAYEQITLHFVPDATFDEVDAKQPLTRQ